jgi:hypothetical protein
MSTRQPLGEVFGFPIDNLSPQAEHYRVNRLCPYNNKVPSCTKSRVADPIGVCSVFDNKKIVVTCPVRMRQDWQVISDAATHIFSSDTVWTSLGEVRLNDVDGNSAGNIDFVLVSFDESGQIVDFGALEIQTVYISGNISNPFNRYMKDRRTQTSSKGSISIRPDYLSSSRKRLVPQIVYKGKILNSWGKKIAVAIQDTFFDTLPKLPTVDSNQAEVIWLVYGLVLDKTINQYKLFLKDTVFTQFQASLDKITTPRPGNLDVFVSLLQNKLDIELEKEQSSETTTLLETYDTDGLF